MISNPSSGLSPIEDILEEARQGRMFILVDDEDRENEGDLVIPARHATADAVNFMARHGRGLICLAMDRSHVERLGLPPMTQRNGARNQTAFTVSIEAREGVTTGISAADRARTIQVAIDPLSSADDIATPGHVFPLLARDGGVLVRAGHTEASVDVARIAGLSQAAVICEIMNDDGTMARLPDLLGFAKVHGLKVGTIADLIAYRCRTETIVEQRAAGTLDSRYGGDFQAYVYADTVTGAEHVALVRGDISGDRPVPVHMQTLNLLEDMLGDVSAGHAGGLQSAMEQVAKEGRGVVVLLHGNEPVKAAAAARRAGKRTDAFAVRERSVGAQILKDLGSGPVRRLAPEMAGV